MSQFVLACKKSSVLLHLRVPCQAYALQSCWGLILCLVTQDLNKPMQSFARSCSFVSGSTLAASTVPSGTNVAAGSNFPSLSSPPQRTQTLGKSPAVLSKLGKTCDICMAYIPAMLYSSQT